MSSELNRAIAHAVNYHGLDSKLNTPDWQIADLLENEVQKWLDGTTDVQCVERMTPSLIKSLKVKEFHEGFYASSENELPYHIEAHEKRRQWYMGFAARQKLMEPTN